MGPVGTSCTAQLRRAFANRDFIASSPKSTSQLGKVPAWRRFGHEYLRCCCRIVLAVARAGSLAATCLSVLVGVLSSDYPK